MFLFQQLTVEYLLSLEYRVSSYSIELVMVIWVGRYAKHT